MYKTKLIIPFSEAMEMMIQGYLIPATGAYETVKSTPSIKDYPYAYGFEYISYLL